MKVMKNVHLIATDKPSRLGYLTKKGKEVYKDLRVFDKLMPNILDSENQHIYITSDEEIKTGDYILELKDNSVWAIQIQTNTDFSKYKKIILTTDKDLIKDGVQAIDDEFLEWFVKNPSCEKIEFFDDTLTVKEASKLPLGTRNHKYKIIIPKEEPKQETLEEYIKEVLEDEFFTKVIVLRWRKHKN